MLVVLSFHKGDLTAAQDWLAWVKELDSSLPHHELLLVAAHEIPDIVIKPMIAQSQTLFHKVSAIRQSTADVRPWPKASNAMFRLASEWVAQFHRNHWLWVEPDAIPLTSGWLDTLEADYKVQGKPVYGTVYDQPWRHINGVAIWPSSISMYNPFTTGAGSLPFDCVRAPLTMRVAYDSPFLQRMLADPSRNLPMTFPTVASLKALRPGAVLFHGNKDGTLIKRLREQRVKVPDIKPSRFSWLPTWPQTKRVGTIRHLFTDYTSHDIGTLRRQGIARSTWLAQSWTECPVKDDQLPRLWHEAGRQFPYLKDVFDFACAKAGRNDVVLYTNADICVSTDCTAKVQEAMSQTDALYCYRRDFKQLDGPIPDSEILAGADYCGSDLKAFRVSWWRKYRKQFPDMLLGMELWDSCMRVLIDRTNPAGKTCLRNLIYHQRHDSFWERAENRYTLTAQIQSLKTGAEFLRDQGRNVTEYGVPAWYGLKCDLVILGLAHESVQFKKLIPNIEQTLAGIEWRAFVCASRGAAPVLKEWTTANPTRVMAVEEPGNLSPQRYAKMSQLRNTVLRRYRDSGLEAKAILWIDMDVWGFWNANKPIKHLLNRNSWDTVAVNGLRPVTTCRHDIQATPVDINGQAYSYYDWLAYESACGERVLWHSMGRPEWYPHGTVPAGTRFTRDPVGLVSGQKVHSAFGPACFYRPEAIAGLWYDETTGQCEHQTFHATMRANNKGHIYISDEIIALYEK